MICLPIGDNDPVRDLGLVFTMDFMVFTMVMVTMVMSVVSKAAADEEENCEEKQHFAQLWFAEISDDTQLPRVDQSH